MQSHNESESKNYPRIVWFKSPVMGLPGPLKFQLKKNNTGLYYAYVSQEGKKKTQSKDIGFCFNNKIKEYYLKHFQALDDGYPTCFRNFQTELVIFPDEVERLKKEAPYFLSEPPKFLSEPSKFLNDFQKALPELEKIASSKRNFIEPPMPDDAQITDPFLEDLFMCEMQKILTTQSYETQTQTVTVEEDLKDSSVNTSDEFFPNSDIQFPDDEKSYLKIDLENVSNPVLKENFSRFLQERERIKSVLLTPDQVEKIGSNRPVQLRKKPEIDKEVVEGVIEGFKEVVPDLGISFPDQDTSQLMFQHLDLLIKRKRVDEFEEANMQNQNKEGKFDHLIQTFVNENNTDVQLLKKFEKTKKRRIHSQQEGDQNNSNSFNQTCSQSGSGTNHFAFFSQPSSTFQSETAEQDPLKELALFLKQEEKERIQEETETKEINYGFKS